MKKVNIYFLLTCLLTIAACDDRLDIEPAQSISSAVALSTDQGVKTALRGAYDLLSDNDVWGGGQHLSELYADAATKYGRGLLKSQNRFFLKTFKNKMVMWSDSGQKVMKPLTKLIIF